jgi:hypothetical protein
MKQEELYVVLRGSGRMKVDDEIVELEEMGRGAGSGGMWRGYDAGRRASRSSSSVRPLGEDPREDVDGQARLAG